MAVCPVGSNYREGGRERRQSGNVHRQAYTAEYRRADSCRTVFFPTRRFRLLFLFRTYFIRNDLLFSHTLRYIARYHSSVHNCSHDKPTNQLPPALLRRAWDVWIFTSTTPTPLRFEFIFQRTDKLRTAPFWAIMQRVVVIP